MKSKIDNEKTVSFFCWNKHKIKAFVLGADPTNFSGKGKTGVQLNTVFGIGSSDNRYFRDILKNLNLIGLQLEDIYVQNIVKKYLEKETGKNKNWSKDAERWLPQLVKELNKLDPKKKIPAFISAEKILWFLLNNAVKPLKAEQYYKDSVIPIPAKQNKLNRPLIPLFRHPKYSLIKWSSYRKKILNLMKN